MRDNLQQAIDSPWKIYLEIFMYLMKPLAHVYLFLNGVSIGRGAKFYGFPLVFRHRGSKIVIGNNFEFRSWWFSNPLGINHPTILCTWSRDANIVIGNDVGMSGTSVVASSSIEIGSESLIGANSTITDNDFHPIKSLKRRYDRENIKSAPVNIGKNVFIGMNALVLKGVNLDNNAIVPAGAVIRKSSK